MWIGCLTGTEVIEVTAVTLTYMMLQCIGHGDIPLTEDIIRFIMNQGMILILMDGFIEMEEGYKQGDKAFYHESGDIFRVEILENNSDSEWIKYRLRILEVEQEHGRPPKIGTEFSCTKRRGVHGVSGLWHLMDD